MEDLKDEYNKITEQRKEIIEKIKSLEENEIIKNYFELKNKNEILYQKQLDIYKDIKVEEYKNCKHILIYDKIEYDNNEGRSYKSRGCIKCGLDNSVLDLDSKYLPFGKKIMYDYLKNNYLFGWETQIACDLQLANAIYKKIIEKNPNIDDDLAVKYFEIALDNIRNIKVSEERIISRIKRLDLKPDFNRW